MANLQSLSDSIIVDMNIAEFLGAIVQTGMSPSSSARMRNSLGGGLTAMLGAMVSNALAGSGEQKPRVPFGLLEPQTEAQKKELEQNSELIRKAMINVIKADGQVDQEEINRITGKFKGIGVDPEAQRYLMTLIQQPMETERLIAAARGRSELAAQIYGASRLAIEVDTPAEKKYLDQLAAGLGLSPQVTGRIQELVGLQQA